MAWVFLLAYTCSGLAGLVYQVCWTRLLTLYIGHTTAAASAVVGAFLGGLAVGGALSATTASRLSARQALFGYAALELLVAALALLLPLEMRAFAPLLAWSYADGTSQVMFPVIRLVVCLVIVFIPATALGATFPLAVRWFTQGAGDRARSGGALYAINTAGAAAGALLAGFILIPAIGVSGATWVGVAASAVAALCAVVIVSAQGQRALAQSLELPATPQPRSAAAPRAIDAPWLAWLVLGLSGFAALLHEIAWTRVLTMVLGPTTYALAATLAAVIVGLAIGAGVCAALVGRSRQPAFWLALVLAVAAAVGIFTSSLAGGPVPLFFAEQTALDANVAGGLSWTSGLLAAALIVPSAALFGAAFPLALAMIDDPSKSAAGQFGAVYAVNTAGSVAGALAAGFIFVPLFGLETTLRLTSLCLSGAAVLVLSFATMTGRARVAGAIASTAAVAVMFASTPWDRELLASGGYLYASFVPDGIPLAPMLKAGRLLYYREGAAATVSVRRLTGTTTLAIDGKTDASNRGDMLTQKLVAHLPLLLHERPLTVAVIGLGSGVTVGAALTHPIEQVDVIELSPEVVDASRLFDQENRQALDDPRIRLLQADGRSHLQLATRQYDVIISEPSNPWIAGVAALFTREFFTTARARLAPGGIICQWANAYNISDQDLRAIVATFLDVFPHGTAWLVGGDDVLLVASESPLDARLSNIAAHWARPGVADDLRRVRVSEPFAMWSLFVAGPLALGDYGEGASILTDDRMTLEFSAPRELGRGRGGSNGATLRGLLDDESAPAVIREARRSAGVAEWRTRADMMAHRDAFSDAYLDYAHALSLEPADTEALAGLVRMARLTRRAADALSRLGEISLGAPPGAPALVARAELLAATGARSEAVLAAEQAIARGGSTARAYEQLAALHAEAGERDQLEAVVWRMRESLPSGAATTYYAAVVALLENDAAAALTLATAALARDPTYAASYDLVGAAAVRMGDAERARTAFLQSLEFDAHDSTAYANLGVLALDAGRVAEAVDYFAEALWLDADSALAREGLRRAWGADVKRRN